MQKERIKETILGVGETQSGKSSKQHLNINALVLPKLNSYLPGKQTNVSNMSKLKRLTLADPNFNEPGPVDLPLGSDVYAKILSEGIRKGCRTAQNTQLG